MSFNTPLDDKFINGFLTKQTIDFLNDDEVPVAIRKATFALIYSYYEQKTAIDRRYDFRKALNKQCAYECISVEIWKGK